jgi:glyceraldehyde-3-phosphate dehydrogenase/erythrose-4-phosphate dehydrogenase
MNLAPTSTGSATAIALIFPELKGKLNGLAVRVPLLNGSLTGAYFFVTHLFFSPIARFQHLIALHVN